MFAGTLFETDGGKRARIVLNFGWAAKMMIDGFIEKRVEEFSIIFILKK